jgi:uncharacterized protein YndB with AHSA1/START domain
LPPKTRTAPAIGDEAVKAKTGRSWSEWFAVLDEAGARKMPHREIAAFLESEHRLGGWWDQMVTVAYEQARGLRDKHQKPSGYEISGSKTVGAAVRLLYEAWENPKLLRKWLPDGAAMTVRKATSGKSMRITWADGTSLNVYFDAKGGGKSQVAVQHGKLRNARDAARIKAYWAEALERLKAVVEG